MAYHYVRGQKLYIGFVDAQGRRRQKTTGLSVGQEDEAERLCRTIERKVDAQRSKGKGSGPLTLQKYGERWIEQRAKGGLRAWRDEANHLRKHVFPALGADRLDRIRPADVRGFVQELKNAGLANKTVRNIYGTLHRLFEEAVAYEVLDKTPCRLMRNDLPKNIDRDPQWREGAVFTREEIIQLLFDRRIARLHRTMYGLLALTGARAGEVVALTWRAYCPGKPLGRLSIHRSFNAKAKAFRPTKSEVPRQVPVHPMLAELLAEWRSSWGAEFGRSPVAEDLIMPWVPRRGEMEPWRTDTIWKRLQRDLTDLELRSRRVHDFRRSFISLCRQDGARDDLLKWVTHGRPPGIMDVYTTPPWPALCAQVQVLDISRLGSETAEKDDLTPPPKGSGLADSDLQSCLQCSEPVGMIEENEWSRRESNPRPKEDPSKALRA